MMMKFDIILCKNIFVKFVTLINNKMCLKISFLKNRNNLPWSSVNPPTDISPKKMVEVKGILKKIYLL